MINLRRNKSKSIEKKGINKKVLEIIIIILIVIVTLIFVFKVLVKQKEYSSKDINIYNEIKESNEEKYTEKIEEVSYEAKPKMVKANVPIFMYHFILEDYGDNWDRENFVRPSTLEEQIKYVAENGYESIFLSEVSNLQKYTKPVCFTFDDCFVYFYNNAFPLFKKYNVKATIFVITDYIAGENYLTEDQIKEMSDSGLIDVQSHTAKHLDLTTLNDEELEYQIKGSKDRLEKITGKKLNTICYPYGRFNNKVLNVCKKYYEYGTAMDGGSLYYNSNTTDLYTLDRIYATRSMNISEFTSYLKQAYVNVTW